MSRRSLTIAAATAVLATAGLVASPASATATITQLSPSSYFYFGALPTSGSTIDETITFTGLTLGSAFSLSLGGSATADFSNLAATFNTTTPLTITTNNTGSTSSFSANPLNGTITAASNVLRLTGALGNITGTTVGSGTYSGTLTVLAAAVPEASSWAMMTLGFGALGYMLRRRRVAFTLA